MNVLLLGSLAGTLLGWLMGFLSLFLILLILIQRGKGGGLTGALGGPGGQSAFGSKAGDTFTVITVVVASIWAFTCAFTMWLLGTHAPPVVADTDPTNITAGPGDTDDSDQTTIPPLGGSAADLNPAAGGIGAASGESESGESESKDLELTPAESNEPESRAQASPDAPAESEASNEETPE